MNHTSRKRKDREGIQNASFYSHKGSFVNKQHYQYPHQQHQHPNNKNSFANTTLFTGSTRFAPEPGLGQSNRVLAGYMAHEFLTKGTLFGQKFDPARAEAVPVSAAEPKRKSAPVEPVGVKPNQSYAEVAQLVKGSNGAHIPGIVNPTQLGRWIQM